jgi:hypothetical protein
MAGVEQAQEQRSPATLANRHKPGIDLPEDEIRLRQACPNHEEWRRRWRYDAADLAPGAATVATSNPFLLDLVHCGPA